MIGLYLKWDNNIRSTYFSLLPLDILKMIIYPKPFYSVRVMCLNCSHLALPISYYATELMYGYNYTIFKCPLCDGLWIGGDVVNCRYEFIKSVDISPASTLVDKHYERRR